ncbi:hypothetical protein CDAR_411951 [Caerostris darwini]|uniref:Uncharacterized protein n=1 Tax=Caerostris darwini TaxID=1538125 RepID=A0AAV4WDT2_9ARAC|nr:hypothetical protein CDAR_411951 [Caerostris darwini]
MSLYKVQTLQALYKVQYPCAKSRPYKPCTKSSTPVQTLYKVQYPYTKSRPYKPCTKSSTSVQSPDLTKPVQSPVPLYKVQTLIPLDKCAVICSKNNPKNNRHNISNKQESRKYFIEECAKINGSTCSEWIQYMPDRKR